MTCIQARGLRKRFGSKVALDGIDFQVDEGRILGLIGPNGAGKSTALQALLGFVDCEGSLSVLGLDARRERARLMQNVSFVADVAVLPRWMRVSQLLDYVAGVHPGFSRSKAEAFLGVNGLPRTSKVGALSKGLVTQLHLAVALAIDAKLLVLDEPTLGLDLLVRKRFYDSLLEEYLDHRKTILISTHQVDEIQDILTDFVFLDQGRVVLASSMEELESRYVQLMVRPEHLDAARALAPLQERLMFGRHLLLFENVSRERLEAWGEVHTPSIADLFLAHMARRAEEVPV